MSVEDIKQRIVLMTETRMLPRLDNVYKESLRQMIAIFSNLYYIDGNSNRIKVNCVHGNSERIAGRLKTDNNLILPLITISEVESTTSSKRERYSPLLIQNTMWNPDKRRAMRVLSLAPRAVDISYEINIWCKYKADLDMIRSGVFSLFNPELKINTLDNKESKAFIGKERSTGSVIATDTKDRVLQKTIEVTLQTYIPSPEFLFTNTGEITEINV